MCHVSKRGRSRSRGQACGVAGVDRGWARPLGRRSGALSVAPAPALMRAMLFMQPSKLLFGGPAGGGSHIG